MDEALARRWRRESTLRSATDSMIAEISRMRANVDGISAETEEMERQLVAERAGADIARSERDFAMGQAKAAWNALGKLLEGPKRTCTDECYLVVDRVEAQVQQCIQDHVAKQQQRVLELENCRKSCVELQNQIETARATNLATCESTKDTLASIECLQNECEMLERRLQGRDASTKTYEESMDQLAQDIALAEDDLSEATSSIRTRTDQYRADLRRAEAARSELFRLTGQSIPSFETSMEAAAETDALQPAGSKRKLSTPG